MKKRRGPSIAEVVTAALERMERARLRTHRDTVSIMLGVRDALEVLANPAHVVSDKPPAFVHVFTAQRGYYHALIALDAAGQLWERHQTVDKANKVVTEEWWEKMPMERRP